MVEWMWMRSACHVERIRIFMTVNARLDNCRMRCYDDAPPGTNDPTGATFRSQPPTDPEQLPPWPDCGAARAIRNEFSTAALKWTHHGCRRGFDLVTAFLGAIDGAVTDVFRGYQVELLHVVKNLAISQAFVFRIVPSFTGFARRRYHGVLLSWRLHRHLYRISRSIDFLPSVDFSLL